MKKMKFTFLTLCFLLFIITFSFGQKAIEDTNLCKLYLDTLNNKEYYLIVNSDPVYPGGQGAMMQFITSNFNYPNNEKKVAGRIITECIINKDGTVSDFRTLRGINEEFDSEAIRVLRMMPNWIPGKCGGQAVNVKMIIPIYVNKR